MLNKCPPFKKATLKDPYFRRFGASDKKAFWKIFSNSNIEIEDRFKDLFERIAERNPHSRLSI
jgi:hypothetical protein